jgi:hypothetical protein
MGSNRNGTTWLTNIISNHSEVSSVQHDVHWGMKENNMFRNLKYWGDISDTKRLIKFMSVYGEGDYFRLSNDNRAYFYSYKPDNFIDFFLEMMDRFTKRQNNKFWVTKLDTHFYSRPKILKYFMEELDVRYDNTYFVSIKRDFGEVLESYLNMQGSTGKMLSRPILRELGLVLKSARRASNYICVNDIHNTRGGIRVKFDDLRQRRPEVARQIVNYLDISFEDRLLSDYYPSNSSFRAQDEEHRVPEWEIDFAQEWIVDFFASYPKLSRMLIRLRDAFRSEDCPVSWRLLKIKFMTSEFKRELDDAGRTGLSSVLFGEDENA